MTEDFLDKAIALLKANNAPPPYLFIVQNPELLGMTAEELRAKVAELQEGEKDGGLLPRL